MLPKFSVKKPFTVIVAVVIVVVLGVIAFINLSTDLFPSISMPYAVVFTGYPGAAPAQVEEVVTKPVEQSMATVSNVKNVSSQSSENSSMVILEFTQDVNMDTAMLEMRESLDMISGYWPDQVASPMIMKIDPAMLPVMIVAVDKEGMEAADLTALVEEEVLPAFEQIDGIASVTSSGGVEEQIEVVISEEKLAALNERLASSIEYEMRDAYEELDEAREELADGKEELSSQKGKVYGKLNAAEKQLAEGKAQLEAAEEQALLGVEALQAGLEEARTAVEGMKAQKAQVDEQIALLEQAPILDEQSQALLAELKGVQGQLEAAIGEGEGQIALLEQQLAEAVAAGEVIAGKKEELTAQEEQLSDARGKAASGFKQAADQIQEGEEALEDAREQLEEEKEKAVEAGDVTKILTVDMIKGMLTAQNFSMQAGTVSYGRDSMTVKVGEEIPDVETLSQLVVFSTELRDLKDVTLGEVADIRVVRREADSYAKLNGNDGIILSLQKQSLYSTSKVSEEAKEVTARLEEEGIVNTTILMDQGIYIDLVVGSVMENLILGGILAILILLLFLRDVKPTLVIALSIPLSLVFAIVMMYFTGVSINVISLAGLALGVGMLVDNSVVVIENIYRMRLQGTPAKEAAVEGAKQVTGAIIASTLTTVCVFLPIVFAKGISKQLFTDMGLTIAFSLLASLIVALTVVPTLASGLLRKEPPKSTKGFVKFQEWYGRFLRWTLDHKWAPTLVVVILLVVCGVFVTTSGTAFMPEMDSDQISVTVSIPEDDQETDPALLKEETEELVALLMDMEEVESVGALGGGGLLGGGENSMSLYTILRTDRDRTSQEVGAELEKLTAGFTTQVSIQTSSMDMSALGGSGISLRVKGDDLDQLALLAQDYAALLADLEGTINVKTGVDEGDRELRVIVDKQKAIKEGLTVAQIYTQVAAHLSTTSSTTLHGADKDYPVIVLDEEMRDLTHKNLRYIEFTDGSGEPIQLWEVADFKEVQGFSSIARDNHRRYLDVSCEVDSEHNIGLVSRELESRLKEVELPAGYTVTVKGENETIADALGDILLMILLAVVLVYLIMVAQFQSLLSPFVVLVTLPLAFTGGVLGLMIFGLDLSVIALLGFLVLAGVVVNNGIVFIDYINILRAEGMPRREAIVEAGKTRLRPILMTALTTVLGLVTMSFGMGQGGDLIQPLAVVSMCGLIYATALTLIVVPGFYEIVSKKDKPKQEEGE